MNNCIFCKIITGELPSVKIYEDEELYAFLDINPVNIGHTLVVPKKHFENLYETPDEILCEMTKLTKKLSINIKNALKADGINIEMNNDKPAGQLVPHAHLHIIPRFEGDGFTHWHGKRPYNENEALEIAKKIREKLL